MAEIHKIVCDKCNWFRYVDLAAIEFWNCQARKSVGVECLADGNVFEKKSDLSIREMEKFRRRIDVIP